MLDVQELEARSGESCLARRIQHAGLQQLGRANNRLAEQNHKVHDIASQWLADFGPAGEDTGEPVHAWPTRLLRRLLKQK